MDQNLINKIINRNAAAFDRTFMRRNRDGDDWWSDSKLNISSIIKETHQLDPGNSEPIAILADECHARAEHRL